MKCCILGTQDTAFYKEMPRNDDLFRTWQYCIIPSQDTVIQDVFYVAAYAKWLLSLLFTGYVEEFVCLLLGIGNSMG